MNTTYQPGDRVRVRATGQTGTVTYPGLTGFPDRVYVNFRRDDGPRHMRSLTFHYHPAELERTAA